MQRGSMRTKTVRCAIGIALVTFLTTTSLWGQAFSSIRGIITDPSGATVPNAKVTLTNSATGAERTTEAGATGEYDFAQVPPGPYFLTVEVSGFKKYEANNLHLEVNNPATLNIRLEVGRMSETVAVSSETPLLNTVDASIG